MIHLLRDMCTLPPPTCTQVHTHTVTNSHIPYTHVLLHKTHTTHIYTLTRTHTTYTHTAKNNRVITAIRCCPREEWLLSLCPVLTRS